MQWTYRLLSPNYAVDDDRELVAKAWECWRRSWGEMWRELERSELDCSDDFLRQHEIGALFCGSECTGVSGFRWVDLALPSVRDDSYFKPWPPALLDGIPPNACIGSNLVVAPEYRGALGLGDFRVSEALLTFAVLRFRQSDAAVMVGTMRNDRKMNQIGYRLGARPLAAGAICHHVPVDLIVFDRESTAHVRPPRQVGVRVVEKRGFERRRVAV